MDASECGNRNRQRNLIVAKNNQLHEQIANGEISDLEALALLTEYAASFSPNNAENFVQDLGAVITGYGSGNAVTNELENQAKDMVGLSTVHDEFESQASDLGQSGFADIFQDETGNQPHHFWFYVQTGFEAGQLVSDAGVVLHENIAGGGMSDEDMYLGFEGTKLGTALQDGSIQPYDVRTYIMNNLAPNTDTARLWDEYHRMTYGTR
jgi:hypothetical protein